jgi:hypothetical protein
MVVASVTQLDPVVGRLDTVDSLSAGSSKVPGLGRWSGVHGSLLGFCWNETRMLSVLSLLFSPGRVRRLLLRLTSVI